MAANKTSFQYQPVARASEKAGSRDLHLALRTLIRRRRVASQVDQRGQTGLHYIEPAMDHERNTGTRRIIVTFARSSSARKIYQCPSPRARRGAYSTRDACHGLSESEDGQTWGLMLGSLYQVAEVPGERERESEKGNRLFSVSRSCRTYDIY